MEVKTRLSEREKSERERREAFPKKCCSLIRLRVFGNGKTLKKWIAGWILFCMCLMGIPAAAFADEKIPEKVMVITVQDEVEPGLASYIERNLEKAREESADLIILELNTPGGRVDAAKDIKNLLYECEIPTWALVKDEAISAGAYIALCCDQIAMMPASTLGDAEMLVNGERADEKYLGPWREEFASIAEDKGRDPQIAKAFVDRDIEIPGVVEKGKLLTLSPNRAKELGYCDALVENREALLKELHAENAEVLESEITGAEQFTRIVTSPAVAPLLLSVGIVCIFLELLTPGVGIFAVIGVGSLLLYFGGHMIAGMASWFALLLFLAGLILCFIEILTPGFGIFALSGIGCIVGSIFLTTPDLATAVKYLAIVLLIMAISAPILLKLFSKSRFFDRLLVRERLTTEEGYVAGNLEQSEYIGKFGVAATTLRPAGTVQMEDGTRLDVVTRGEFIEKGEQVVVTKKEGTWLVVERRGN